MAEAIGVAASVLQLVNTVRELRIMIKAIHDVPRDLKNTLDDIENFEKIVAPMITSMQAVSPNTNNERSLALVSGQSAFHALQASHSRYEEATSAVKVLTDHLMKHVNKKSHLKAFYQLKAIFKKEELTELKEMMESARRSLDLAISCYNTTLIMAQLENLRLSISKQEAALSAITATAVATRQDMTGGPTIAAKRRVTQYPRPYQKEICGLRKCYCECHQTTSLQPGFWPLKISSSSSWKPCSKASCRNSKNASVWISFTQIGIRLAISLSLDVMLGSQESYIRPSLSFQRVVRRTSPGFTILYELKHGVRKDWGKAKQDLLELFESGKASPRDVDPDGVTWLEKLLHRPWPPYISKIQYAMLDMLAQMGTQINTSRLLYRSVSWIGVGPHLYLLDNLLRLQFDASEIESLSFPRWPKPLSPFWFGPHSVPDPFFVDWIAKNTVVCPGFAGINPLMEAILIDTKDEAERLLHKYHINDQGNLLGLSALHLAVFRPQHLQVILDSGADVNVRDRNGITPLMYAMGTGKSEVAIKLLVAGAEIAIKDKLYDQDWLKYAAGRRNWDTVIEILKYVQNASDISTDSLYSLSTSGLILWVQSAAYSKDENHLCQFLKLGADPNVTYDTRHDESQTLAHQATKIEELKILIAEGFTNFNHVDSSGSHALLAHSQQNYAVVKPGFIEILLDGGSTVNLQNNNGHTALHAALVSARVNDTYRVSRKNSDRVEITQALYSIEVLLRHGAGPLIGDYCDCYCSHSGCNPSHLLLKKSGDFGPECSAWALEYLEIVRTAVDSETAKHCLLDMLRVLKFEELELTHTCCKELHPFSHDLHIVEDEEISEIHEEEIELAELLDKEMQDIENCLGDNYDEALLAAVLRAMNHERLAGDKQAVTYHGISYEINQWNDQFRLKPLYADSRKDDAKLIGYIDWVEYEHSKNQNSGKVDDEWYGKRRGWILRMEEAMGIERKVGDGD